MVRRSSFIPTVSLMGLYTSFMVIDYACEMFRSFRLRVMSKARILFSNSMFSPLNNAERRMWQGSVPALETSLLFFFFFFFVLFFSYMFQP